jgi:hypothetical protein
MRALGAGRTVALAALGIAGLAIVVTLVISLADGEAGDPQARPDVPSTSTSAVTPTTSTTMATASTPAPPAAPVSTQGGGSADPPPIPADADPRPVPPRFPIRCSPAGDPTTGSVPNDSAQDGKRWVTVQSLTGNCDGASAAFELRGIDTRLVVRNDAMSLDVFVVDVDQGRDATAGFSDVSCPGPCAGFQALVLQPGRYRLEVQADDAPWQILVQEYRTG